MVFIFLNLTFYFLGLLTEMVHELMLEFHFGPLTKFFTPVVLKLSFVSNWSYCNSFRKFKR